MNILIGLAAVAGTWFVLNMFGSLHTSIIGVISGYAVSWFQVLFGAISLLIVRACFSD